MTRSTILLTAICALPWLACADGGAPPPASAPLPDEASVARSGPLLVDRAAEAGLDFVHFNGMSGQYYFHEMMGSGAALFDFDRDGDLDAYLVQGSLQGETTADQAIFPPAPGVPLTDRLFRNELRQQDGSLGELSFTDVTGTTGLVGDDYGMGVATGDVDNDGWVDLYVTSFEENRLWHNEGDGTFTDWTERSGVGESRWSVPAVFLDFDRDGWLDLFVGNYVEFSVATHKRCTSELGGPNYCGPMAFPPVSDRLFRNRGDGTFEDVSGRSGINRVPGSTLGAIAADFDGDGWLDLYVANDQMRNFLWINRGDGTFEDRALLAGCAVNRDGRPEASMGVDAVDFDRDGDEDLIMAHLRDETNTLYVNDGDGLFEDRSGAAGLGDSSLEYTSFGIGFLDVDRDGWRDLVVASGAVKVIEEQVLAGDAYPLHQRNQLLRNRGRGVFEDVTAEAGPAFQLSEVSRATVLGDVDEDGDTDVLLTNNSGPARLLINVADPEASWLGLRLLEPGSGRDALGAWVHVLGPDGWNDFARVHTSSSYLAARDPRVIFGLGDAPADGLARAEVLWPDGSREAFDDLALGRYHDLERGRGRPLG